jgi:hypothetical protein
MNHLYLCLHIKYQFPMATKKTANAAKKPAAKATTKVIKKTPATSKKKAATKPVAKPKTKKEAYAPISEEVIETTIPAKATAKRAPKKSPAVAAPVIIGRPVEIPDKRRMTIDLTGELVTLCKAEIKATGDLKSGISPFVRKVLATHFENSGKTLKNKC